MKKIYLALITVLFLMSFSIAANANVIETPSGIKEEDLEGFIDNYVKDYIGKTVAGANIIVLKDNRIIFSKGYGYADLENKIPMEPKTTILEWGSVSKLFVWTSVMQLVEQGEIDLNEDIRNYLPEGFLQNLNMMNRLLC